MRKFLSKGPLSVEATFVYKGLRSMTLCSYAHEVGDGWHGSFVA